MSYEGKFARRYGRRRFSVAKAYVDSNLVYVTPLDTVRIEIFVVFMEYLVSTFLAYL